MAERGCGAWLHPATSPSRQTRADPAAQEAFTKGGLPPPVPRAVLVVDQAGWHTSPDVVRPEGIDLVCLPSASPPRQPAERGWPLVDEPAANRAFANLTELEAVLIACCRPLEAEPQHLKAHPPLPLVALRAAPIMPIAIIQHPYHASDA